MEPILSEKPPDIPKRVLIDLDRCIECRSCAAACYASHANMPVVNFAVSGAALNPGSETEAPARFQCDCGGWSNVFIPGSVNTERLVVTPKEEAEPA